MTRPGVTVELVSDANLEIFGRYLSQDSQAPACLVHSKPFGQLYPALLEEDGATVDFGVVWTRPEGAIAGFAKALDLQQVDADAVMKEVEDFAAAIAAYARRARFVFVVAWSAPTARRGYGMLDWRPGLGIRHLLTRMNLLLAEKLAAHRIVFMLDPTAWLQSAGPEALSQRMWFAAKVPYGNRVFQAAIADLKAAMAGAMGRARKLIVLDLDDTLWGGAVGETGWEGIRLGGHDHVGEAFAAFQDALKALGNRGVQLGIVSKNDERVALEAIDRHPEMRLRRPHLAGWRINWDDKARNLADLVQELNLGLDAVVFIDDNPFERARIREALPEVLVPDWPDDPCLFASRLMTLACFDTPAVSEEDRSRARMYADERARRGALARVGSMEVWLATLGVEVEAALLGRADLARAAQLFNKTNQLNLSTRRLSEEELFAWASEPDRRLWTIRVRDRFGDLGLVGIVSLELDGSRGLVRDFLLSCRAMGRRVEETMLHLAISCAQEAGVREVIAEYRPTPRNRPCLEFLESSGLDRCDKIRFAWQTASPFRLPSSVTLVISGENKPGVRAAGPAGRIAGCAREAGSTSPELDRFANG
jgi:FkbH-like protein